MISTKKLKSKDPTQQSSLRALKQEAETAHVTHFRRARKLSNSVFGLVVLQVRFGKDRETESIHGYERNAGKLYPKVIPAFVKPKERADLATLQSRHCCATTWCDRQGMRTGMSPINHPTGVLPGVYSNISYRTSKKRRSRLRANLLTELFDGESASSAPVGDFAADLPAPSSPSKYADPADVGK